jgi:hypothetical protein
MCIYEHKVEAGSINNKSFRSPQTWLRDNEKKC